MRNKILSLLLAFALILGLFPVPALAAAPTSGNCGAEGNGSHLTWSFSGNTLTISGAGRMKDYGYQNPPWISHVRKITTIELPEKLTRIGSDAFKGCENLRQISLPSTLESTGYNAFDGCSIETIHLPKAYKYGFGAFENCRALRAMTVDPENPTYFAKDGVLFTKADSVLCFYPEGRPDLTYEIPEGTTSIQSASFENTQFLEEVSIPGSVKAIGISNFDNCPALKKAVLAEGIETIEESCFKKCRVLDQINIPGSVRKIGAEFLDLTAIQQDRSRWENGLLYVDEWLICSDNTVSPDCVVRPGTRGVTGWAFENNKAVQSITLPDGLIYICQNGISYCDNLTSVSFPDSMTIIEDRLLKNDGQLKSVHIPAKLESIGDSAFQDCTALEQLSLPQTLSVIGSDAFLNCNSLKDIYYAGSRTEWEKISKPGDLLDERVTTMHYAGGDVISGTCGAEGDGSNLIWTLDSDTLTISGTGAMASGDGWVPYSSRIRKIIVEEGVTSLCNSAFSDCYAVEAISLPETLTTIMQGAFFCCASLKQIHIPASVTEIDERTLFRYCFSLESITVAEGNQNYESIDGVLFRTTDRTLLHYPAAKAGETYCIPDGTVYIGTYSQYPFEDLRNLKTIGVPLSVKKDADTRELFLKTFNLNDIFYEGSREQWDARFDTPKDLIVHCNWTYGSDLPCIRRPIRSDHCGWQNYHVFGSRVYSYLNVEPDGTLSRVETDGYRVILERYDADLNLMEQRRIADLSKEGFYFGGCYFGTDQNFLVFTHRNLEEMRSTEVFRVSSYTKNWKPLRQTHICGANTEDPIIGGSLRMAQYGDYLYIHTCHEMFKSFDGLNHQESMTMNIHIPTMELRDSSWDSSGISNVSHSFNQFIQTDGNKILTLDHGDGNPRAVDLTEYQNPAGQDQLFGDGKDTHMLTISGADGDNETGVSVGGFEISGSSYLVAGNTVDQAVGNLDGQRNIFLSVLPRGKIGSAVPKLMMLTDYQEGRNIGPSTPHLVRISDDRLLVLWTEDDITDIYNRIPGPLCWQMIDGTGTPVGPIYRDEAGMLSDCQPILRNGEVFWYVTDNSAPVFFRISPDHPEKLMIGNNQTLFTVTVDGVVHEDVQPGTPLAQLLPKLSPRAGHTLVWQENGKTVDVNTPVQRDMVLTSVWQFNVFTDVKQGDWFYEGVRYTTFNGLFSGVSETQFGPQRKMNRAMVVQVLYSMAGKPEVTPGTEFRDVPANAWFAKAVAWAVQNGVASGYGNGLFGAGDVITREQLAVMLYGYAGKPAVNGGLHFADEAEISGWAKTALQWAVENEIMSGVGENRISPKTSATRAAGAVMIMKLHQYLNK